MSCSTKVAWVTVISKQAAEQCKLPAVNQTITSSRAGRASCSNGNRVVYCSLLDDSEAEVGRLLVDNLRIALMLICLAAGTLSAQEPHLAKAKSQPAKPPRVTCILFSRSSGMCYGYCYAHLEVESGEATLLNHSRDKDTNKCPDLRVRGTSRAPTGRNWYNWSIVKPYSRCRTGSGALAALTK